MKARFAIFCLCLPGIPAHADVEIHVENVAGRAVIKYECTAGEVVRAFALDVTVDAGTITGVTEFFVGESTSATQGYGLFPASFRDSGFDWNSQGYSPLAVVADAPGDTQPGLGHAGVTLELGGLWAADDPTAAPPSSGALCALTISDAANVSLALNATRGGVRFSPADDDAAVVLTGALVDPNQTGPRILDISIIEQNVTVLFEGGELFWSADLASPWTGTGDTDGSYSESIIGQAHKFFRVHGMD